MAIKSHYMYVLACADRTLYTGYTVDWQRREREHNQGRGAKYTRLKSRQPSRMVYVQAFSSRSLAMSAEYHFKQLTRAQKEDFLYQTGVSSLDPFSSQPPLVKLLEEEEIDGD
ncbi:hypothetical protein AWM75_04005 [Aerococcus urinaehominis]|uniref:Uncharacterized protein n=1 Tax=Aerococcus urinaehominis TaxID=128944 RepID=A0A109RGG6_9LACT|nr:GIY-YIG nuclease family protein [Aerococcus urinaehominis]AMB99220.1 hypothetical protein AWM75_04005 [Aerococcus urinaehominis]SDM31977.1 putative endonuclease [Aerococcus urinaehominis]